MFQVDGASRKRPRPIRLHNAKKSTPTSTNDIRAASVVLQGTIVSVTGLHPDDKERLHQLIVELGGRYVIRHTLTWGDPHCGRLYTFPLTLTVCVVCQQ